jgi:superfamily II DNA helicase RecQ
MELSWIVDYLRYCYENNIPKADIKPIVVYVKTRNECSDIVKFLLKNVPQGDCIGKFHSKIGGMEEYRATFIEEFAQTVPRYLVTVTTLALGAGVHKVNIYLLVLWGFPRKFVDALQMMGRACRDSNVVGVVVAYYFAKDADTLEASCNMFCNIETCRRIFILEHYDQDCREPGHRLGNCCDICLEIPRDDGEQVRCLITKILGVDILPESTGLWHFPVLSELVQKISKPRNITAFRQDEMNGVTKAVEKTIADMRNEGKFDTLHAMGIHDRQIENITNSPREKLLGKSKFTALLTLKGKECLHTTQLYDSVCVYFSANPVPLQQ